MKPLAETQLRNFKADGFLHLPGFIPDDELAPVLRDADHLVEKGIGGYFGDDRYDYSNQGKTLRRINALFEEDMPDSFRLLLAYPPLLGAISQLMDGDAFAASVHAMVVKVPHEGVPVPWHQDPVRVHRFPAFNVDVYLDESNEENGCLYAIPGSHLAGYFPAEKRAEVMESWTLGRKEDAPGAVPVICQPGDVVVHATTVLHGSFENNSDMTRRTLYYHCDHLEDVKLAGDQWPQCDFAGAMEQTKAAIDLRRERFPDETPFDYRYEPEAARRAVAAHGK
jgi:hypothetical protein